MNQAGHVTATGRPFTGNKEIKNVYKFVLSYFHQIYLQRNRKRHNLRKYELHLTRLLSVDNFLYIENKTMNDVDDTGLDTLLGLDGETFHSGNFWAKFEVRRVKKTKHIPHGIRYSLTLHDANNTRILGYDNAHSPKLPKGRKRYIAKKTTWDHKHELKKVYDYKFDSPAQLIEDFWKSAEKMMAD